MLHYLVPCEDCGASRGVLCSEVVGRVPHPARLRAFSEHRDSVRLIERQDPAPWLSKYDLLVVLDLLLATEPDDQKCLAEIAGTIGNTYALVTEVGEE